MPWAMMSMKTTSIYVREIRAQSQNYAQVILEKPSAGGVNGFCRTGSIKHLLYMTKCTSFPMSKTSRTHMTWLIGHASASCHTVPSSRLPILPTARAAKSPVTHFLGAKSEGTHHCAKTARAPGFSWCSKPMKSVSKVMGHCRISFQVSGQGCTMEKNV